LAWTILANSRENLAAMSTASASETSKHDLTLKMLKDVVGPEAFSTSEFHDNLRLHVPADQLLKVLETLKSRLGFAFLSELGGVDYLGYPNWSRARYEVHYVLRNLDSFECLIVKTGTDDPKPTLPTVTPLWPGADWMEREVFDMYGIVFEGHPDLRRILMPDEFAAFPLRKDYPLRGRGERHNFPKLSRGES
jgi:NADH-quinone oxidoreductase subunit C